MVYLRGVITGGNVAGGTVLLTLPVGYRPTASRLYAVANYSGAAFTNACVLVAASGEVQVLYAAGNNWISFDGVSFDLK